MASGLFFPHSSSFKRIMVYYAYIFSVALQYNNLTFAYIIIIIRITYFSHVKGLKKKNQCTQHPKQMTYKILQSLVPELYFHILISNLSLGCLGREENIRL